MNIAALSQHTVIAIGSSQVLTDSASVVKELVDNALDAKATSIFVEISQNSLDTIKVKDNGLGIPPADWPLLGRRYCTSKIRDLTDLSSVGGTWLGFRGEALASAAEMSGELSVCTKVAGEPVATTLMMNRQGEIIKQDKTSHPIGTTVCISDFLKNLPVRKQISLNCTTSTLSRIKKCLQSYAIARPAVRFSLKILKAKSNKGNWIYAPKAGAMVTDAALRIVGKEAVAQCEWKAWRAPDELPQFSINALIPTGTDIASLNNLGQYMSIDCRPVANKRGAMKQVLSMFKSHLQSTYEERKVANSFLCMNIVCPPASYDANIEPSKDEVLFTDVPGFFEICELFFKSIYGPMQEENQRMKSAVENHQQQQSWASETPVKRGDARLSSLPRLSSSACLDNDSVAPRTPTSAVRPILSSPAAPSYRTPMYTGIDEYEDLEHENDRENETEFSGKIGRPPPDFDSQREEGDINDPTITNPWTIAKMNAPVSRKNAFVTPTRNTPFSAPQAFGLDLTHNPHKSHRPQGLQLLTPIADDRTDVVRSSNRLDNWIMGESPTGSEDPLPTPSATRLGDIPDISQRPSAKKPGRPTSAASRSFVPSVRNLRDVWFDIGSPAKSSHNRKTSKSSAQPTSQNVLPFTPINSPAAARSNPRRFPPPGPIPSAGSQYPTHRPPSSPPLPFSPPPPFNPPPPFSPPPPVTSHAPARHHAASSEPVCHLHLALTTGNREVQYLCRALIAAGDAYVRSGLHAGAFAIQGDELVQVEQRVWDLLEEVYAEKEEGAAANVDLNLEKALRLGSSGAISIEAGGKNG